MLMNTLIIEIPEKNVADLSDFITRSGGNIISPSSAPKDCLDDDDEVTHARYFGENIRRVIHTFFRK